MADTYGPIDAVYKQMYSDNVSLAIQVKTNPFEDMYTPIMNLSGREMQVVELVGSSEMIEDAPETSPSPVVPPSHEGIFVQPRRGTWGRTVPKSTPIKAAVEYTGTYLQEGAAAAARHRARIISAAITGPRLIRNDETALPTVVPFDWANRSVANNYKYGGGGSSSGMSVAKIVKGLEKLGITDLDVDLEDICLAMTMKENTDLYNDVTVISKDYQDRAQLSDKKVRSLLGIRIKIWNKIGLDPTGTYRACPMWTKSGVHYGEAVPLETSLERVASMQFQPYMFLEQWIAATRSEDEKVVALYCDPAVG